MTESDEIEVWMPSASIVVYEDGDPGEPIDTGLLDQYGNRILYRPPSVKMGFAITEDHAAHDEGDYYFPEEPDAPTGL